MSRVRDLDTAENIREFIDLFYARVLTDELLAPIFIDVAEIDVDKHLSFIRSYWEKLLLGSKTYDRHTMNIHRALNQKFPFSEQAFTRWLELFISTAEDNFSGPYRQRAIKVATQIAGNMKNALLKP